MVEFDPAPFFWLQGIVGLGALLTATVVLTKQNRLAKLIDLLGFGSMRSRVASEDSNALGVR